MELNRILAVTPRAAEYFSVKELQAQTGQAESSFSSVVLKELVDNGIDAAEAANKLPVIEIRVDHQGDNHVITVHDNGPGLLSKTLESILDFNVRASTNSAYRAPTRGLQGNAIKTILGIPFAMGTDEPVVLESNGRRHSIRTWIDPSGHVRIDHQIESSDVTTGTRFTVTLPAAGQTFNPNYWAAAFSTLNPHVTVKNDVFENGTYRAKRSANFLGTADFSNGWRKYVPGDLTAPAWYAPEDMQKLVYAHINADRDLTLREFVRQFRGLTSTGKQKSIAEQFPDISSLSGFEKTPDEVTRLLTVMQFVATPPKPSVLGCVGADHFRASFERHGLKEDRFWYKKVDGLVDGIPFVVEAALAVAYDGKLYHGINFSPCFSDPIADTRIPGKKVSATGLRSYLYNAHCDPFPNVNQSDELIIVFHIVCPSLQFLDRGKTRLANLPAPMVEAISKVLWSVCKTLYAEEERRRKDAAKQERQDDARRNASRSDEVTLKDAVFGVLAQGVKRATGGGAYPTNARNLYYAVRALIQNYTRKELEYTYFSQVLLVEYQRHYGPIVGLYYDPRGVLYEPHTGKAIPIGTREIESYQFPAWTYDKILYIEKKGPWPVIQAAKIAERYDLAVIAAEGYATEAARTLFQRADSSENFRLFVLHDADVDGYNIARTLREETARMRGYNVDVIDLGLHLEDAVTMGLQHENVTRKKAIPGGLELTKFERDYFEGFQVGRKSWIGKRIELNALMAPQLVEYIERKLKEHGADEKVIPPDNIVLDEMSETYQADLASGIEGEIMTRLDVESLVEEAMQQIPEPAFDPAEVSKALDGLPPISWRDAVRRIVDEHVTRSLSGVNHSIVKGAGQ